MDCTTAFPNADWKKHNSAPSCLEGWGLSMSSKHPSIQKFSRPFPFYTQGVNRHVLYILKPIFSYWNEIGLIFPLSSMTLNYYTVKN